MLWQKIDADYHERLAKKRELAKLAAAGSRDGVVDRGVGANLSANLNISQDPEDPAAKVRDCSAYTSACLQSVQEPAHSSDFLVRFLMVVQATRAHAAALDDQMGWLHEHEPINVYDEMDWIANRSRAELRGKLRPSSFLTGHVGSWSAIACARDGSLIRYVCLSRVLLQQRWNKSSDKSEIT